MPTPQRSELRAKVLDAAVDFDSGHELLADAAYDGLQRLATRGHGFDAALTTVYHRRLTAMKRHRFEHHMREKAAAAGGGIRARAEQRAANDVCWSLPHPGVERPSRHEHQTQLAIADAVEQPTPHKHQRQLAIADAWKVRWQHADSGDWYDTPAVYEKAFALDWSRALRTHKLAAFILKNDDGDSDDDWDDNGGGGASGNGGGAGTSETFYMPGLRTAQRAATPFRIEQREEHERNKDPDADDARDLLNWGRDRRAQMEEVDDGPHDEAEIVELGKVLFANVAVVYRAFDWYASADPNSNIRSIGYNAYKAFIDDCALDIPGSRYCDTAHFDQLFIKINAMVVGGGRKLKDDVDVSSALVGRQGMATDIAGRNDDKRALSRHEWLNVLVRIAIMRYVKQRKQEQDASRALARLIDDDLLPRLDPWVTTDHQLVRQRVCYTEEVDDVLALHAMNLELLFKTFADTEGEHTRFKTLRKLLSLSEWLAMMRVLEVRHRHAACPLSSSHLPLHPWPLLTALPKPW